jgi:septum formation protein
VVLDNQVLGKPAGEEEARTMLRQLRGRNHQVFTGLTIINKANGQTVTDAAAIDVPMRDYSDQ